MLIDDLRSRFSNFPIKYLTHPLYGRDAFLKNLRQSLVAEGRASAITCQSGGNGKTHAAIAYAHRYEAEYTELLFANGDSKANLQSSIAAFCDVLPLDETTDLPPNEFSRAKIALDWLDANPGWLLIIDNVDDDDTAQALIRLLGKFKAGHVIITSSLDNWSPPVTPLELSALSPQDATLLLLELAKNRHSSIDDEKQARNLADLLGGLPLALHHAIGFINEKKVAFVDLAASFRKESADLVARLSNSALPQRAVVSDAIVHQPDLITWRIGFQQLSKDERFWLLVFSHFASHAIPSFLIAPMTDAPAGVRAMAQAAAQGVAAAARYNLIIHSPEEVFFKIPDSVRNLVIFNATDDECSMALDAAVAMISFAEPGNPQDVRNWQKWDLLKAHATYICDQCDNARPPTGLSILLTDLAYLHDAKGDPIQAEKCIRRALEIDRATSGEAHPKVANNLNYLGQLLQVMNRSAEAEPLYRDALRILRTALGDDHPQLTTARNNLARLLYTSGRLSEAEPLMQEGLRLDRAIKGASHPHVAFQSHNLANVLKTLGRLPEAETLYRDAQRIFMESLGPEHPNTLSVSKSLRELIEEMRNTSPPPQTQTGLWGKIRSIVGGRQ